MLFLYKDYSNRVAILYYLYSFIKTLEMYKYFLTLRPNMKYGLTLQQKCLLQQQNYCNNIKVIAIIYVKCCNKI